MNRLPFLSVLALCLAVLAQPAQAMMRCGNEIISEGDPLAKVAATCGKPDSVSASTVLRVGIPRRHLQLLDEYQRWLSNRELLVHRRSLVEVPVETWTYNLGPNKLMREVVFEDGRVVRVESLGYGY